MDSEIKFMPNEFQQELLKYDGLLMSLGTQRRDIIRKRLIQVFEKKKLTPQDTDLATYYMEEYDKAEKFTRKAMASVQKRMEYLTKLYKEETAASKRRTEQLSKKRSSSSSTKKKSKVKKYTVHFRILTTNLEKLKEAASQDKQKSKKSKRNITVNGVPYTQVGKEYTFTTKNSWFMQNFKTAGTKNDIIVRGERGEKGSRWRKTVAPVMKTLEELNANNIIAYMDAIYIPKVVEDEDVKAAEVRTELKRNDVDVSSMFNNYLYHSLDGDHNKYAHHPYLSKHFKPQLNTLGCTGGPPCLR